MSIKKILLCSAVLLSGFAVFASAQKAGPKVYVSVDMEGIWGIVHGDQVSSTTADYGPARRWMAEDVNAVLKGLWAAGAGEIVVNDSHGGMRNILAEALDPKASLISGTPKPLSMMQGLDQTFDAAVFVGYHAKAGTAQAILDHTISSSTVYAIRVNGRELPELGLNAAIAGYFNIPVILLTGDGETCAQAKAILGNEIETVAVKEAIGRTAARMLPRETVLNRLTEGAFKALKSPGRAKPFILPLPLLFELEFHNSGQAELPLLVPGVKRAGGRSVAFQSNDFLEGFKLLRALIALGGIN
jgi:D-amino peptidase